MAPNYSLYGLGIYWILAFIPRVVAVVTIRKRGKWNNTNPRSPAVQEEYSKRIPKADYSRFERANAAHNNTLESFGIVAAALIAGSVAGLDNDTLNTAAATLIAIRALYIILYINTTTNRVSQLRSLVWFANQAVAFTVLMKAAAVFATTSASSRKIF
jgi:uncharacterized MAPEG superfamily protein